MEKFEIKNRIGLKIVGEILKPENPIGLSFLLHGLGGRKEQSHMKLLESILFENKYIVINFDATNATGESEGRYEDATMQKHYEDLVDVIAWAKSQNWYKKPFVLAGHSMGGFAVAKYAEEFPDEVKMVFPFAAVYSGKDSFDSYQIFRPNEIKEWQEKGFIQRFSISKPWLELKLPWSHMEERLKHDLKPLANKIIMPILFVVGDDDIMCPPSDQKKFYDLLPDKTQKEFHIIKGAPHTIRDKGHLEELGEIFNNWLKKHE